MAHEIKLSDGMLHLVSAKGEYVLTRWYKPTASTPSGRMEVTKYTTFQDREKVVKRIVSRDKSKKPAKKASASRRP